VYNRFAIRKGERRGMHHFWKDSSQIPHFDMHYNYSDTDKNEKGSLMKFSQRLKFLFTWDKAWIRIRIKNADLDPDPGHHSNADPMWIWIQNTEKNI
jgi:hypothetical protein